MTTTDSTTTILNAASPLAKSLNLSNWTKSSTPEFVDGQDVLIASSTGMQYGKIETSFSETRSRFNVEHRLNGNLLVSTVVRKTDEGDGSPVYDRTFYLPEGAEIYTSL